MAGARLRPDARTGGLRLLRPAAALGRVARDRLLPDGKPPRRVPPGNGSNPSAGASPSSAAFGNVTVGQTSAPQTIIVSNTGTATATDMAYPAAPAKFNKSGTCSGATLNAGATCTVVFTYTPTATVTDNATYTITGGGSTIPVALSGTGASAPAASSLSVSPARCRSAA